MNIKIKLLLIVAVVFNLTACSTIKSYFPDKEKDYQFTTEIPPLILPPDLAGDTLVKVPAAAVAPVAPVNEEASEILQTSRPVEPEPEPLVDRKLIKVELVDAEQATKRLRIGANQVMAWRMVGKALSRKTLEVTDRDQEKGLFHVRYDPNKQPFEDESFLDEINFLFKGFVSDEQQYILKLVETNAQTEVIIMDKDEKPVADATSLSLLTLLNDTIKADLSSKK